MTIDVVRVVPMVSHLPSPYLEEGSVNLAVTFTSAGNEHLDPLFAPLLNRSLDSSGAQFGPREVSKVNPSQIIFTVSPTGVVPFLTILQAVVPRMSDTLATTRANNDARLRSIQEAAAAVGLQGRREAP